METPMEIDYSIPDYRPIGLPKDPVSTSLPAGLQGASKADQAAPMISTWQRVWDGLKQFNQSAGEWVVGAIKKDYRLLREATGTVYDDLSKPVGEVLTGTYWYLILGVIVVGGALYFAGKSGAISLRV